MRLPDPYRAALEDPPPASLIALLAPGSDVPSLSDAIAALEASSDVTDVAPGEPLVDGSDWELDIELPGADPQDIRRARAWLGRAPVELVGDFVPQRGVTQDDLHAGKQSAFAVVVSAQLGPHPLRDFHRLVRLLGLLAPDAAMVYDLDSLTPRAGHWLRDVAAAGTPPSPAALFTIHDVAPEDGDHWLHTHGLARCGILELDVLQVPSDGAGLMGQLINSVASLFIERGLPAPDEPFHAGEELELVWLPLDEAMQQLSPDLAGGPEDRDDSHSAPRGVLFCAGTRESPAKYLPILRENPLLYISDMETERMTLLASERLPRFLRLLSRFGKSEGWLFLVKLGYPMDDAESPSDREHLWFEVHGYEGGEVDATLLNEPYRIARLSEGARAIHSLDRLSDWSILCERGRFDANTVAELERSLHEAPSAH